VSAVRGRIFPSSIRASAIALAIAGVLAVLSAPTPALAQRQSGIQLGLDGSTILVNKDIGNERWTIAFDGAIIVSGNVYPLDGSAPSFVWCESMGRNAQDEYMLACYGAPSCTVGGCGKGAWTFIANVNLPASFFALPESGT